MNNSNCFIWFLVLLLFTNCKSNDILLKSQDNIFSIKKIDSTLYPKIRMSNNEKPEMFKYYFILAKNKNKFFTIMSSGNMRNNCKEIKIGNSYKMKIDSTESLSTKFHFNQEIKSGVNDIVKNKFAKVKNIYGTRNLQGLCYRF